MTIVYAEEGMYAGWPANHGAWQWSNEYGEEWLVGFLRGKYVRQSMHNIRPPYEYCFARSLDEGATWSIENHGQEFDAQTIFHPAPHFDMRDTIRRVCGVYDHGGDHTDAHGGFFLSHNRGLNWHGPYCFAGLEDQFDQEELHCTSRQCELPGERLIFLSNADRYQWGTDRIFVAEHQPRSDRFKFLSYIDGGQYRAVMPAAAMLGHQIVVACRRRNKGDCWIDSYISDDGGRSWSDGTLISDTGGANGNPPALIESDGTLICAYGNRKLGTINVRFSGDGRHWSGPTVIAEGSQSKSGYYDLGYPRLFRKQDGKVAVVYYIATKDIPQQHIAMEIIR